MRGYVPDQMPQRDDALNRTSAYRAPLVWRVPEGPGTPVGQRSNTRNHAGSGCSDGGRWQGLEGCWDDALNRTSACRAPLVWRVPEGPGIPVGQRSNTRNHAGSGCGAGGRWQGLAGLRDDAPSEARGADGERAGRRPPACRAARPHSPAPRQGATVPGAPVEPHTTVGNQPEYPASSVARWTPPRPASWAAWVRHEKPSARYTASG